MARTKSGLRGPTSHGEVDNTPTPPSRTRSPSPDSPNPFIDNVHDNGESGASHDWNLNPLSPIEEEEDEPQEHSMALQNGILNVVLEGTLIDLGIGTQVQVSARKRALSNSSVGSTPRSPPKSRRRVSTASVGRSPLRKATKTGGPSALKTYSTAKPHDRRGSEDGPSRPAEDPATGHPERMQQLREVLEAIARPLEDKNDGMLHALNMLGMHTARWRVQYLENVELFNTTVKAMVASLKVSK